MPVLGVERKIESEAVNQCLELNRVRWEWHLADVVVDRRGVREGGNHLEDEKRHDADNPHDDDRAQQPESDESDHNLIFSKGKWPTGSIPAGH